ICIVQWYAVHNELWAVSSKYTIIAPDHDVGISPWSWIIEGDAYTRSLSPQHFCKISCRLGHGFVYIYYSDRTSDITLFLSTITHNYDFIEPGNIFFHHYVQYLLVCDGDFLC